MPDWLRHAVELPHYKLAAFLLALTAWSYVQLEEENEVVARTLVEWRLPPGLIAVEQLPQQIECAIRGTGATVRKAVGADLRMGIDLEGIGVGEHRVEFSAIRPEGLPETVALLGCQPSEMTFNLDEEDERKVELVPVHVGQPADGYLVGDVSLEPSVVRLRGPRRVVSGMAEVPTRPIEVSGLSTDATLEADLELPRSVELVDITRIKARVSVVPELERRTLSAPVVVWQQSGWVAEPDLIEVTLEGPASQVARVQAEEVVAFTHLPDDPDRPVYEVVWGPKEGVRLRLLHGAGDAVEVVRVEPSMVEVRRR